MAFLFEIRQLHIGGVDIFQVWLTIRLYPVIPFVHEENVEIRNILRTVHRYRKIFVFDIYAWSGFFINENTDLIGV